MSDGEYTDGTDKQQRDGRTDGRTPDRYTMALLAIKKVGGGGYFGANINVGEQSLEV